MRILAEDRAIVRWADCRRLRYYYTPGGALERACLRVHLGHVTADFDSGKLVRLNVATEGRYLDEAFCELTQLFDLCRRIGAYLEPAEAASG